MKKFFKYCLLVLLFLFVLYGSVIAQTIVDRTTSATFSWSPVLIDTAGNSVTIDHYELCLVRDVTLEEYTYGTQSTSITILKPRSGVFTAKIRAAKKIAEDQYLYSEWCTSLTPCAINYPWKVRFKPLTPIGPIIISKVVRDDCRWL